MSGLVLALASALCDDPLLLDVKARLPSDHGAWSLRCADEQHLELSLVSVDGAARTRVISLADVSRGLRVDVAVMSAEALVRPPRRATRTPLRAARTEELAAPVPPGVFESPWGTGAVGPQVGTSVDFFPRTSTWMLSGEATVAWRGLRIGARVWGARRLVEAQIAQLLAPQLLASAALLCLRVGPTRPCLRLEVAGGAALVWGDPKLLAVNAGVQLWQPMLDGRLVVEARVKAGPLWVEAGVRAGATVGPMLVLDPTAGWSGFAAGVTLGLGWGP